MYSDVLWSEYAVIYSSRSSGDSSVMWICSAVSAQ